MLPRRHRHNIVTTNTNASAGIGKIAENSWFPCCFLFSFAFLISVVLFFPVRTFFLLSTHSWLFKYFRIKSSRVPIFFSSWYFVLARCFVTCTGTLILQTREVIYKMFPFFCFNIFCEFCAKTILWMIHYTVQNDDEKKKSIKYTLEMRSS